MFSSSKVSQFENDGHVKVGLPLHSTVYGIMPTVLDKIVAYFVYKRV